MTDTKNPDARMPEYIWAVDDKTGQYLTYVEGKTPYPDMTGVHLYRRVDALAHNQPPVDLAQLQYDMYEGIDIMAHEKRPERIVTAKALKWLAGKGYIWVPKPPEQGQVDDKLPCDFTIGPTTFRKGVKIKLAEKRAQMYYETVMRIETLEKLHPLGSDRSPDEVKGWNDAIEHVKSELARGKGGG